MATKLVIREGHGSVWWVWRFALDGSFVNMIGPFRSESRASTAANYLKANP